MTKNREQVTVTGQAPPTKPKKKLNATYTARPSGNAYPVIKALPDYNLTGAAPGTRAYAMGQATILLVPPQETEGWRLVMSYPRSVGRYPTWQEIGHARDELITREIPMVIQPPNELRPQGSREFTLHMIQLITPEQLRPATFADLNEGSARVAQAQASTAGDRIKPIMTFVRPVLNGRMEIGRLMFNGYKVDFEGDATESALAFFKGKLEPLLQQMVVETFRYQWDNRLAKYASDELYLIEPEVGHYVLERLLDGAWKAHSNHPSIALAKETADHACDAYTGLFGAPRWIVWQQAFEKDFDNHLYMQTGRCYQASYVETQPEAVNWRIVCIGHFTPPNTLIEATMIQLNNE